jgi:carbon monoxide dehydrogenase subunit G
MLNCEISIAAPADRVFKLLSDFAHAPDHVSGINKVEMLTPGPVRVGTKFKETRMMFGKEATETMEVTTFDPPRSYTIQALSCGVEFRSTFRCTPEGTGTKVRLEVETTPKSLFAKILSPIMKLMMGGMMKKCVMKDLADVKIFAEKG